MQRTLSPTVGLLGVLSLLGCTTVRHSYPDQDPVLLWAAVVAVAETPDYSDDEPDERWSVKENHVRVDAPGRRLLIARELVRFHDLTSTRPFREEREFRFELEMDELPPPTVTIVSRGTGVPGHARAEAERLLTDVAALLTGNASLETEDPPELGANAPDVAVRDLLYAVLVSDGAEIRRLIMPTRGAAVLWEGDTDRSPSTAEALQPWSIRLVEPGEEVTLQGRRVPVTGALVNADRALVIATRGEEVLEPLVVLRVDGRWRVDARPIIERQTRDAS